MDSKSDINRIEIQTKTGRKRTETQRERVRENGEMNENDITII